MTTRNTSSSSLCPILTIPNEVLLHILNLVEPIDEEKFVYYRLNDRGYQVSQWLLLRSVCRHFRALSVALDFWYKEYFAFPRLLPPQYSSKAELRLRFIAILFSDENLVDGLGRRKTNWVAHNFNELKAIVQGIPLFKENARTIRLQSYDQDDIESAMELLSDCRRITTFSSSFYSYDPSTLDLTVLATSLPLLENLCLTEMGKFAGSLENLVHLKSLCITSWNTLETSVPWLPRQSAHSLTALDLTAALETPHLSIYKLPCFSVFHNLTSLTIGPLTAEVCTYLLASNCHLETFGLYFHMDLAPIDVVITMFQAECLQTVKNFLLLDYYPSYGLAAKLPATERYWSRVWDALTSNLSSIEQFEALACVLPVECCAFFSRMTNLKGLSYHQEYAVSQSERNQIEEAIVAAFAGFAQKPRLDI